MSWTDLNDEIYEKLNGKVVVYHWNGIPNDNSGKKVVVYLSEKTRIAFGKEFALATPFVDNAKTFDTIEDAQEFLKLQNESRPHPLGEGWNIDTVANVVLRTGGRDGTHVALMGLSGTEEQDAEAATPKM